MADQQYELIRQTYKPADIKWLFVAESAPPPAGTISTRHFYLNDVGEGDRLFTNTVKALYPEVLNIGETDLARQKHDWLKRFQSDGCYMIESLEESLPHGTTPAVRKQKIKDILPQLITKIEALSGPNTKIILIKSNPYNIASGPLKEAGLNVINDALIDYPGYWREEPYRQKLLQTMQKHGWM